jgi:hypothetical protein
MKRFIKLAAKAFVAALLALFSGLGQVLVGDAGLDSVTTGQWFTLAAAAITAFLAVYSVPNTGPPPPPPVADDAVPALAPPIAAPVGSTAGG